MHLHPTVGRLMLDVGREFGLSRVRVPAEPPAVLARCGTRVGLGAHALYHWTRLLRRQVRAAEMATSDHCFGIAWSGHMTRERMHRLLAELPDGDSEVYFHPAVARDDTLRRLMPDYEHEAELAALLDFLPDSGGSQPPGRPPQARGPLTGSPLSRDDNKGGFSADRCTCFASGPNSGDSDSGG